jgi:hypothetical protein
MKRYNFEYMFEGELHYLSITEIHPIMAFVFFVRDFEYNNEGKKFCENVSDIRVEIL